MARILKTDLTKKTLFLKSLYMPFVSQDWQEEKPITCTKRCIDFCSLDTEKFGIKLGANQTSGQLQGYKSLSKERSIDEFKVYILWGTPLIIKEL